MTDCIHSICIGVTKASQRMPEMYFIWAHGSRGFGPWFLSPMFLGRALGGVWAGGASSTHLDWNQRARKKQGTSYDLN